MIIFFINFPSFFWIYLVHYNWSIFRSNRTDYDKANELSKSFLKLKALKTPGDLTVMSSHNFAKTFNLQQTAKTLYFYSAPTPKRRWVVRNSKFHRDLREISGGIQSG